MPITTLFLSSCFVHCRKPDEDIFRLALDIAQVWPERVLYLDDQSIFVEVAQGLGIRGICHRHYDATRQALQTVCHDLWDSRDGPASAEAEARAAQRGEP